MWLELIKSLGVPLLAGLVGALLTNYFSARFSFDRFRKEQWWQEKRVAYEAIIRKLSEIIFNLGRELEKEETGEAGPAAPQRTAALSWSLQEIALAGAYVVSQTTAKTVQDLLLALATGGRDFHSMLEGHYIAAKTALEVIRAEAHRDLGIEQ